MSITIRPAQTFVTSDSAAVRDDFDVLDGGHRIGRIYSTEAAREPWCWSVSRAIAPNGYSGRTATRVLALQMLVDTYRAVKSLDGAERRFVPPAVTAVAAPRRTIRSVAGSSDIGGPPNGRGR
jgi:hypothetical protein